ncbi:nucleoside transporter [Rubritalea squalenifaciens DSM 18772]|uniref:Nucleoside transporter n=1 Tax=Rubritalea squalenifaciens DSM 18772 TaxID=1123071 RepID=A0A1M6E238_9BACT|nr:MFS transporter [Rubritalea squalenifaciens]SHI79562.1 nucleoside transporter [Rubritalea squalenifaciens DSM 18772]
MSNAKASSTGTVIRLSIMMFLQFFIWGAWYVALWGFLDQNGMTAIGAGGSYDAAAYTVAPIAAILAPLTLGLIADRFLNTEKVLSILFLIGAALLYYAPSLASAGAPDSLLGQFSHPMILCLLAYMICFMPTLGLTASLSFSHLDNAEKQFPIVRVLGTIGWIVGNWVMWGSRMFTGEQALVNEAKEGLAAATESGIQADIATATEKLNSVMASISFSDNSQHIFTAAAIASALLGIYCLTLPKTAPPSKGKKIAVGEIVGKDAWGLLKNKSFFVFALASFLICIPLAGYYAKGYGYVGEMGVTLFGSTTGAMSTGQMSEIIFMLIMPFCFARLGVKWMLTIGMAAWVARYGLWGYAFGQEGPMLTLPIFIGILLHGICYDFFFVTGMIYTDKKAPPAIRNQAQSLVVMLTQGLGLGIGAQLFGQWTGMCTSDGVIDFAKFWYVPAAFALGVMVLFFMFFWDKVKTDDVDLEEAAEAATPDSESAM